MGQQFECKRLCQVTLKEPRDRTRLQELIRRDYRAEWIVDDLPSATPLVFPDHGRKYEIGFHLGQVDVEEGGAQDQEKSQHVYLHNHFQLRILYRPNEHAAPGSNPNAASAEERFIVGFEVLPKSIKNNLECKEAFDASAVVERLQMDDQTESITYTYGVEWVEDKSVTWARRWDNYIDSSNPQVHWYSIVNSLTLLVFLTLIVAMIMMRTLNKDIAFYNDDDGLVRDGMVCVFQWGVDCVCFLLLGRTRRYGRLENCPWGCVPCSKTSHALLCPPGLWSPSLPGHVLLPPLQPSRHPQPLLPRWFGPRQPLLFRLLCSVWGLPQRPHLQSLQRHQLEDECLLDSGVLPPPLVCLD